jgi:hypothetical protein
MILTGPEAKWESELVKLAERRRSGFIRCAAEERPNLKEAALKIRDSFGAQSIVFTDDAQDGLTVQYRNVAGSGPI